MTTISGDVMFGVDQHSASARSAPTDIAKAAEASVFYKAVAASAGGAHAEGAGAIAAGAGVPSAAGEGGAAATAGGQRSTTAPRPAAVLGGGGAAQVPFGVPL